MENFTETLSKLDKEIEENPEVAEVYYKRASLIYHLLFANQFKSDEEKDKYCNSVLQDLNTAISLRPDYLDAYVMRAGLYDDLGNEADSHKDLSYVLERDDSQIRANHLMSLKFFRKSKYEEAVYHSTKVIDIEPEYREAYLIRAQAYGMLKDVDSMYKDFDRAFELCGEAAEFYNTRALMGIHNNMLDEAMIDINKALELAPWNPEYCKAKSAIHELQGDDESSYKVYIDLFEKTSYSSDYIPATIAYINRGVTRFSKENYEGALADFNKALNLDIENVIAFLNRGILILKWEKLKWHWLIIKK